jgi:hypothetical protein
MELTLIMKVNNLDCYSFLSSLLNTRLLSASSFLDTGNVKIMIANSIGYLLCARYCGKHITDESLVYDGST